MIAHRRHANSRRLFDVSGDDVNLAISFTLRSGHDVIETLVDAFIAILGVPAFRKVEHADGEVILVSEVAQSLEFIKVPVPYLGLL